MMRLWEAASRDLSSTATLLSNPCPEGFPQRAAVLHMFMEESQAFAESLDALDRAVSRTPAPKVFVHKVSVYTLPCLSACPTPLHTPLGGFGLTFSPILATPCRAALAAAAAITTLAAAAKATAAAMVAQPRSPSPPPQQPHQPAFYDIQSALAQLALCGMACNLSGMLCTAVSSQGVAAGALSTADAFRVAASSIVGTETVPLLLFQYWRHLAALKPTPEAGPECPLASLWRTAMPLAMQSGQLVRCLLRWMAVGDPQAIALVMNGGGQQPEVDPVARLLRGTAARLALIISCVDQLSWVVQSAISQELGE